MLAPQMEFHTSNIRGAGTDATVFVQLCGEEGETPVQRIVAAKEVRRGGGEDANAGAQ